MKAKKVAVSTKDVRKQAKAWMVLNDIRIVDIQAALNMHHTPISYTLSGSVSNRRVLDYLLKKGCPAEYLALPEDMLERAA